jgi:hypothetical protein
MDLMPLYVLFGGILVVVSILGTIILVQDRKHRAGK